MNKTILIAVVFFFSTFAVFAETSNRLVVRVSAETVIEKDRVELSDIAQFHGDSLNIERLKTVSLGYSPNIGAIREISRERIALAIAAAGFAANEYALESPNLVRIRRAGQEVNQTSLREALEKEILSGLQTSGVTANIVRLDLPPNIQIPAGKIDLRASIVGVRNFFSPFVATIEIRVDGRVFRRISATTQIEAFADVLVAAKDLTANTKITESDVRTETRRLEKPLQSYLREVGKLRGAMLIKNLTNGAEITTDSFVAGAVVKMGDSVRIIGQSGKLQILVTGEARANGKIGDRITVKNLQSSKIIQAVVVDEGIVKVNF